MSLSASHFSLTIRQSVALFIVGSVILTASAVSPGTAGESRLDAVEQRGTQVMPFSLALTRHVFTKTKSGGRQQVIAKDPSNTEQIKLIRVHLSKIAQEFSRGECSDPAKIHGAEIDYSSASAALVNAIHDWFDAQLRDHDRHAVPLHLHSPMRAE